MMWMLGMQMMSGGRWSLVYGRIQSIDTPGSLIFGIIKRRFADASWGLQVQSRRQTELAKCSRAESESQLVRAEIQRRIFQLLWLPDALLRRKTKKGESFQGATNLYLMRFS